MIQESSIEIQQHCQTLHWKQVGGHPLMCASKTCASRSSRYVAGPTWSESAVLPHRGRDMGVGQKKWDWGFLVPDQSHQSFQAQRAQFLPQAKTKGRKERAKMARILCHPLWMERENAATRTSRNGYNQHRKASD